MVLEAGKNSMGLNEFSAGEDGNVSIIAGVCGGLGGQVISVRGSVVDVRFTGPLPEIYSQLVAGPENEIIIEVVTHLDANTARGIALTPTQGLAGGQSD